MRRRPSPALVIAILALIGAWGGPAVAQTLIGSAQIKDDSIRGKDIRANTVTGRNVKNLSGRDVVPNGIDGSDIDEDSLDAVPSARSATTAERLTKSAVTKLDFAKPSGTEATTVYSGGGLTISATCEGGELTATAAATSGLARLRITAPGASTNTGDDDLKEGDLLTLLPAGVDAAQGELTYLNPGGDAVTVSYLAQEGLDPARGFECVLGGTAVRALA